MTNEELLNAWFRKATDSCNFFRGAGEAKAAVLSRMNGQKTVWIINEFEPYFPYLLCTYVYASKEEADKKVKELEQLSDKDLWYTIDCFEVQQ